MLFNKTYNENCLATMQNMADNFIDLTITSPPYDNLRDYNGYSFEFEKVAKELYRVTKQGGVVVWIVGDGTVNGCESLTSFKQAIYFVEQCGFNLHDTMIYSRQAKFPDATRYWQDFEYMLVLSKGKPKTINLIRDQKPVGAVGTKIKHLERQKNGELLQRNTERVRHELKVRSNIWYCPAGHFMTDDDIAFGHPAMFPEDLVAGQMISWSNEGDLIYDCFMGSGTVAKIAHIYKRNWIGSEISKEYAELSDKRLESYLQQTSLF